MKNISDIQRACSLVGWGFPVDQVEKMTGFGEIGAHGWEVKSLARAVEVGGDDADFCSDAEGALVICFSAQIMRVAVIRPSIDTAVRMTSMGAAF